MKTLVRSYSFDASAQQVTFSGYTSIDLENVLLITNVKENVIIYQFNVVGKGGTASTNVLTLDYDTTAMADTDELQIFYDDPAIEHLPLVAIAYNGSDLEYLGRAAAGSAKNAAVWQICKLTYSGSNPTDIKWADGNQNYDNVWDNRASLSYS